MAGEEFALSLSKGTGREFIFCYAWRPGVLGKFKCMHLFDSHLQCGSFTPRLQWSRQL